MELLVHRAEFVPGEAVPLFELKPPVFEGFDYVVKRTFDIVVSSLLLLMMSPLLAAAALAVRLSSRGPVVYRSMRPGIGGVPFACLKFRTMYRDADQRQADLESLNEATGALFKMRDDPRMTPVGRFLRKYSIDELPQLFNVLRGEMSLVGPRPLPERDFDRLEEWHKKRYLVTPGITGPVAGLRALRAGLRRPRAAGLPVPRALVGLPRPQHPRQDRARGVHAPRRVLRRVAREAAQHRRRGDVRRWSSSSRSLATRQRRADAKPLPGHSLRYLGERARASAIGTAVRGDVLKAQPRVPRARRDAVLVADAGERDEVGDRRAVAGQVRLRPGATRSSTRARDAGQAVRGHTLVWHVQLPGLAAATSAAKDLAAAMREHIQRDDGALRGAGRRVGRRQRADHRPRRAARSRCSSASSARATSRTAFVVAHQADPNAKLYLNEIGAESIGPKSNRLLRGRARAARPRASRSTASAFRCTRTCAALPSRFRRQHAALQGARARRRDHRGRRRRCSCRPTRGRPAGARRDVYRTIVRDCLAIGCTSLTFWGFTDGRSWISETQPGMGAATLLDDALRPKPAFRAVQKALAGG